MTVLLSIKPEFAIKIFNGTKKYEFRRAVFKRNDIKKVVVYASSPVQQVIGEFEIEEIISDTVRSVWEKTSEYSGITKNFYESYFGDKDIAHAIKIGRVKKYSSPKLLEDYNIDFAPQSFVYLAK